MSKKNKQELDGLISSVNKLHKFKSRLILGVIITVVVAVIIAFLIIVIGSESQDIIDAYNNISGPPHDSKQQFGTKNIKITVTPTGKLEIELVTAKDKDDNDITGTSDSDPGTPDGDVDSGSSDDTIDDPEDKGSWTGDGFELNAMDVYTAYTFNKGSETGITINGVKLYSNIPWQFDGNWYKFSVNAASDYLEYNLGSPIKAGSSFHIDNNNSASPINKNGVDCMGIAWIPIFCFINTNEDGSLASSYGDSVCEKYYGAVILENNGNTYYMPICSGGDNKGHTFPGGLAQTYIGNGTVADLSNGTVKINAGGSVDQANLKWNGSPMHGMEIDIDDFRSNWSTATTYNGGGMGSHPSLTIETNKVYVNALAGYNIKGYIIHKN